MSTQKYVFKLVAKIFILTIISIIAFNYLLASPIISNDLALGQMTNSNEMYMLVQAYDKVKPIILIVYSCIAALLVGTTIYDTFKFINKGEN